MFVGVVLALEMILTEHLDGCRSPLGGLAGIVSGWHSRVASLGPVFAIAFWALAALKHRKELLPVSNGLLECPVRWPLVAAHFFAIGAYACCSLFLCSEGLNAAGICTLAVARPVTAVCAVLLIAVAIIPVNAWIALLHSTGYVWIYSLVVAILTGVARSDSGLLWDVSDRLSAELTNGTLLIVSKLLHLLVPRVITDPAQMLIGTPDFCVKIAPACSGLEGMALMLIFGIAWLSLFRREYAFPQALLILPVGILAMFLVNAGRIAALIFIGTAGAEQIALGGFHSHAGWIGFNVLALVFSAASSRLPWVGANRTEIAQTSTVCSENATAAYLLPFLAILAAGMISRAISADFEWLYPLRFTAVLVVLWFFRRTYEALDWTFGWFGLMVGVVAFCVWMGLTASSGGQAHIPAALAAASGLRRGTWIVLRIAAVVITCPIAEELAFRGYFIRRFISRDFELVSSTNFTWVGLLLSSLAFGVLHGRQWLPGIVVGLLYAIALVRKGRIGDAVAAHATTNALLAGYILFFQRYDLW
ncbi:MAG: exosortase E/protease, VPEID-CTERM system [Acidobacteriaceae bacterium]|nr:exosortase E/protease, VPEID-CTERM system [Acidobacteriaceae bacterium]